MKNTTIEDCQIHDLKPSGGRGFKICGIGKLPICNVPIKRVYYLYDIPAQAIRGGHAHRELYQLVIAVSGSFRITLDDGRNKIEHVLADSTKGLLIVPGIWRDLDMFSNGGACLVLASEIYDEMDYIRDFNLFQKMKI